MAELKIPYEDPDEELDEIISVRLYISRRQLALLRGFHADDKPIQPPGKRTFSAWVRETAFQPYAEHRGEAWPEDPATAGGYRGGRRRKVAK